MSEIRESPNRRSASVSVGEIDDFAERTNHARPKRAVAVIRVSRVGKREADKFISPEDQLKLIDQMCVVHNFNVVQIFREIDQSGYRTKFEKRKGLYPATQMVESGQAEVVVMGFFDRMARNIVVQTEFLGRVGRAGGQVWAHDWGRIQTDGAAQVLASGMMGLVAQFVAQSTAEKTQGPKERAIERGIPTFPWIPAGYRLVDRRLVKHEAEAKLIEEAFLMRAAGASYHAIRDYLRANGLMRSTRGVQEILKNRIYLGELRFGRAKSKGGSGELVNLESHKAIIDEATFKMINDKRHSMRVGPRGDRESIHGKLLSRQQILRCAACGRAMIVCAAKASRKNGKSHTYITYRCPPIGDCTDRAAIIADNVDAYVAAYMKQVQEQGAYSAGEQMLEAKAALKVAEDDLRQAMRNLATERNTVIAREIIEEFREKADLAQQRVDSLARAFGPAAVRSMADWDDLTLAGRRDLVRVLIKRIDVRRAPRGATVEARVTITAFE